MHILPKKSFPYYIAVPKYVRTSAGIKALHLLCHHLNLKGYRAFLLIYPYEAGLQESNCVNHDLITPLLNRTVLAEHAKRTLHPITVLPESAKGNSFNSPCVVRYCGNVPGLLGGDKIFSPEEVVFSFSGCLAKYTKYPKNVLFIPTVDTDVFYDTGSTGRKGSCFYAGKYSEYHRGELFDITANSVEIRRSNNPQSPNEIASLFRSSKVFFTYENTALIIESMLCGCPAVCLPNPYFTHLIGADEIGKDGYCWGATEEGMAHAALTVDNAKSNYFATIDLFYKQLENFITLTQEHASKIYSAEVGTMPNQI